MFRSVVFKFYFVQSSWYVSSEISSLMRMGTQEVNAYKCKEQEIVEDQTKHIKITSTKEN